MMTRTGLFGAGLCCLLAAHAVACSDGDGVSAQTRQQPPPQVQPRFSQVSLPIDTATAFALSSAFRAAASRALPAVVRVNVTARVEATRAQGARDGDGNQQRRSLGTGSGFIIDTEGHIITNDHVIANAERVSVVLTDGREYEAQLVASDPNTDVGVIRVDPAKIGELTPARFGDSDSLRVGDWVLALGNPLDLSFTVTAGIVSAKGRNLNILRNAANTQLEAFIQTDAAINPGNSGGPLVDLYGRVIGVNGAIQTRTGFFSGAGFAIPINLARKVADDLITYGVVHRPRLGVIIQDVNAADAEFYKLPAITGVEISSVTPGTPAEKAGLRMSDVVVALNGQSVHTVAELQDRVARLQPGDRVNLGIIREGASIEKAVELSEFRIAPERATVETESASGAALLGFSVEELPRDEGVRIAAPAGAGLRISGSDPFGPAAEASLPTRVLLVSINGQDVKSVEAFEDIASRLRPGQVVSIVILDPNAAEPAPQVFNYRLR